MREVSETSITSTSYVPDKRLRGVELDAEYEKEEQASHQVHLSQQIASFQQPFEGQRQACKQLQFFLQ